MSYCAGAYASRCGRDAHSERSVTGMRRGRSAAINA